MAIAPPAPCLIPRMGHKFCAECDDDQALEQLPVEHLPAPVEAAQKPVEGLRSVCAMALAVICQDSLWGNR